MRALIVVRLSRVTDATTSPERQLEACRTLCDQRGYEVVGVSEDLDVSAKMAPAERPQLGKWMTRPEDYDVLVVYRMDRIVRRLLDLADLIRWGQDHSVSLVSATEAFLDLTAPFGDIVALLVAKVAEMELAAISERNRSAARHNIKAGKYRGGMPPWGYIPAKDDSGEWRLVQNPEQAGVIKEVVDRVLMHEPLRAIAHDLTERRVLTPRDSFAKHQGRTPEGRRWSSGRLKQSLTSESLLGYAMSGGVPVRNDDGSPVVRAEPILTREVFDRVGVELSARENRKEPYARSTALLLRVLYCVCGRQMYSLKGGKGRQYRYRCASAQYKSSCGGPSCLAPEVDRLVETSILALLEDSERLDKVWDTGDDHSAELAAVDAELADLAGQLGTAAFLPGTPQRVRLNERIEGLAQRQAELSRDVVRPAGWVWRPTGERFGDWWASQDVVGRNVWLRDSGVRLTFDHGRYHLDLGDVETITKQLRPTGAAVEAQRMFATMTEGGIAGAEVTGDDVVLHFQDGRTVHLAGALSGSLSDSDILSEILQKRP